MAISGDIEDKKIAPILLLSFIENAFKHGVNKNVGRLKSILNLKSRKIFFIFQFQINA
jgi:sensor histidine kinase YesM